jgi:molybdate transport system ATP-binding protein
MAKRLKIELENKISLALDLDAAPIQVLFGPSGAGKSTLLRAVAGLDRPAPGSNALIALEDEVWLDSGRRISRSPQLRGVGYLAQDAALFPHLRVRENIAYGPRGLELTVQRRLEERLEITPLLERRPRELSGGEKQRVALARALAVRPRLLLLDEPFSALDAPTREMLRSRLSDLLRELAIPAILVTHDRAEAFALGHEIHILDHGRVLESGPLLETLLRPKNLRAARIAGVENIVPW